MWHGIPHRCVIKMVIATAVTGAKTLSSGGSSECGNLSAIPSSIRV
jgi:hypothetical protein